MNWANCFTERIRVSILAAGIVAILPYDSRRLAILFPDTFSNAVWPRGFDVGFAAGFTPSGSGTLLVSIVNYGPIVHDEWFANVTAGSGLDMICVYRNDGYDVYTGESTLGRNRSRRRCQQMTGSNVDATFTTYGNG